MARMANFFAGRSTPPKASDAAFALKLAVRKLWSDHVVWTREYIVAAIHGSADAEAAAKRLLQNQDDIGQAIAPVYGAAAGQQLTKLLKEHVLIAVDLLGAAKIGDQGAFKKHDARWTKNAEEIATFLSGANPHLPKKDLVNLLNLHLTLTKNEAVARLEKRWADDVKAFDDIFVEILTVADALSDAIVKQFPDKFGK